MRKKMNFLKSHLYLHRKSMNRFKIKKRGTLTLFVLEVLDDLCMQISSAHAFNVSVY
jgi:hypothetical protein